MQGPAGQGPLSHVGESETLWSYIVFCTHCFCSNYYYYTTVFNRGTSLLILWVSCYESSHSLTFGAAEPME